MDVRISFAKLSYAKQKKSIFLSFGLLYHQKIISNYVDEEISYGELSVRNSDLIAENKDLIRENAMLVKLMKAEKEKLKNEMNIQQDKLNSEVQRSKDLQRNLQGRALTAILHQTRGPWDAAQTVGRSLWFRLPRLQTLNDFS